MRVAALYDIHGNLPALEAVLRDVDAAAPDLVVIGGDVVLGPLPAETLERLGSISAPTLFISGNTDREVVEHVDGTSTLAGRHGADDIWVRRGHWVAERLTRADRNVLAAWPPSAVVDIDGLGPTLFCHGSPRSDEEPVTRITTAGRLTALLDGVDQQIVVCGHTHAQLDRRHDGRRVVNAGSVGAPREGRPGAYWAMLGDGVELRRTAYDLDEAGLRLIATGYPEAGDLVERLASDDASGIDSVLARIESAWNAR